MENYKLCYMAFVDDNNTYKLYFTDNYEDQWGDDWNDRPADCNAESPYEDETHHIVSMYVEFDWMVTDIIFGGKTYAVEDMNKSGVPWLIFKNKDYTDYKLLGGMSFTEVLTILEISGVATYWLDKELVGLVSEEAKLTEELVINNLRMLEEEE